MAGGLPEISNKRAVNMCAAYTLPNDISVLLLFINKLLKLLSLFAL